MLHKTGFDTRGLIFYAQQLQNKAAGENMWYGASTIGKCLFDFAVKPNLKRNSDTKNKNGTVE